MNKIEMRQALDILIMVTGDCPYERGIGKEEDFQCKDYPECVTCWKTALSRELKNS